MTLHSSGTKHRILFDHQAFMMQRFGGVSRYFSELIVGMRSHGVFTADLPAIQTENINYHRFILREPSFSPPGYVTKFARRVLGKIIPSTKDVARNQRSIVEELRKGSYDLFHPTYYDPYFLDHLNGKPFVLTVYDLIHELFPEYFAQHIRDEMVARKRQLIMAADRIIAISERTKNDIISYYSVPPEKVVTVHLATSFSRRDQDPDGTQGVKPPYIVFVGTREIYKNFTVLIEAISPILRNDRSMRVFCTGPGFSAAEHEVFERHDITRQMQHVSVNDEELRTLYSGAVCLAYPSAYEGFGLPILEAFACGCPVLTSNTSSLPEVGGEAVFYCDPNNLESIRHGIERLISEPDLRVDLKERGFDRLKQFSWESTVRQTEAVYREVIESRYQL